MRYVIEETAGKFSESYNNNQTEVHFPTRNIISLINKLSVGKQSRTENGEWPYRTRK